MTQDILTIHSDKERLSTIWDDNLCRFLPYPKNLKKEGDLLLKKTSNNLNASNIQTNNYL